MYPALQKDLENLEEILQEVRDFSVDYLSNLDHFPTGRTLGSIAFPGLPAVGAGAAQTHQLFKETFLKNIVASSGSRYWGYVTGGTTPAAIAGDWLTSIFDQNTFNTSGLGDVSAILELETIKMMLELFELPATFNGGFVSGATMSNFTCLAVARQWFGKTQSIDIAKEGNPSTIKMYAAVPHSSSVKALSMLGLGSKNLTIVPTSPGRECIDIKKFKEILARQPNNPFILIASAGTVNTVDFDDMEAIAQLRKEYNFWWHIDAAFGAFASCSTDYKYLLHGWELADSITVDCHKWLNVPYDSAVFFTKKEHENLQKETFQNANAPYLGDTIKYFSYLNFVPESSRRFRALPVWFTLQAYGKAGYCSIVENNITLAKELAGKIENSAYYQLAAPVRLNTVCFTVKDKNKRDDYIKAIITKLNENGKIFLTPTLYNEKSCIRAALVNWRTGKADIEIAMKELTEVYELIDK
ncbi:MAG: aspartate aminotransferase family protein [Ferruginibacter sp.]|nr:aspartate aminotransferase family protein [Ferruginibacter sp.]